jgi:hypothetical protein
MQQPCELLRTRGFYSPSCSFAMQRTVTNTMANNHLRRTPCNAIGYRLVAKGCDQTGEQPPNCPANNLANYFRPCDLRSFIILWT